jgi:hypothetical protein
MSGDLRPDRLSAAAFSVPGTFRFWRRVQAKESFRFTLVIPISEWSSQKADVPANDS